MNKHILFKMDHLANAGKYSNEELTANSNAALDAAKDAADIVADTSDLGDIGIAAVTSIASYASYAFDPDIEKLWIDEYFKITGEDRQLYINELGNKMNEEKTINELTQIDGAFDEGNTYECVTASGNGYFSKGAVYQCNGMGIIDNDGVALINGNRSTFKLVTQKGENKTMRTPFNLDRAIAGDKVVDKNGLEYNQFSVIKTLNSTLINCYSVGGDRSNTYTEKTANKVLFMAPKMGKGFVNVYGDCIYAKGHDTRELADSCAAFNRTMCIDLSQFPEGYGL